MSVPWMPLYVADYLADTGHLSAAEHGAYLMLIMHYWRAGLLPTDEKALARIARMSVREWQKSRDTIAAFFDADWRHERIENELRKAAVKSERRAESGARGGNAKALKNKDVTVANATDLPEQKAAFALASSSDVTVREESISSEVPSDALDKGQENTGKKRKRAKPAYSEKFERFWLAYPTTPTMSKKEAGGQFERLDADDQDLAIAAIPAFKQTLKPGYELHAVRYLRHRRFEGFAAATNVVPIVPQFTTAEDWAANLRARRAAAGEA